MKSPSCTVYGGLAQARPNKHDLTPSVRIFQPELQHYAIAVTWEVYQSGKLPVVWRCLSHLYPLAHFVRAAWESVSL